MRLAEVIVFAKDLARMRSFYGSALGLRPLAEGASESWQSFEAGGVRLSLHAVPPSLATAIHISTPPVAREGTPIKLSFSVSDVDTARERLIEAGAAMREARRFGELMLCDGVDPEGNVFQLRNG